MSWLTNKNAFSKLINNKSTLEVTLLTPLKGDELKLKIPGNINSLLTQIYKSIMTNFSIGFGAPCEPIFMDNTQGKFFPCHNGIL